jgi:hypothetical protein
LAESQKHFEQAAKLIGHPKPGGRLSYGLSLLGQILRQLYHRLWPGNLVKRAPEEQALLLEAARIHERLGELAYWSNQTIPTIYAALQTLNLAERAGTSPELVRAYASMGLAAGFLSLHSLAQVYNRQALAAAQSLNSRAALVWVLEVIGVYAIGRGEWVQAQEALSQAVAVSAERQDWRRWEECAAALSEVAYFQGKFTESLAWWPQIYASASRRDDAQARSWGLAGQLRCLLQLGQADTDQARAALATLETLLAESIWPADEISSYGSVALARLRLGQPQLARQAAEAVMNRIRVTSPTVFSMFHGYANATEVYLGLWSGGDPGESPAEYERLARQACRALHRYGRVFAIGQPRAWLYQGVYDWQKGQPARAYQAWHKSLALAGRLAMPFEQGLAHDQLGRRLPPGHPDRPEHQKRAESIFEELRAA